MTDGLIGHTGFVGANLDAAWPFAGRYNSANIGDIEGRRFEHLFVAAAPGIKWRANRHPAADRAAIDRLCKSLSGVKADQLVLISSIDVYPEPRAVDESTPINRQAGDAYGRHRLMLEDFVRQRFSCLIVRLPGLFGPGLRKNALFDLLSAHRLDALDPDARYQFYDLRRLGADMKRFIAAGEEVINLATEPLSLSRVAAAIEAPKLEARAGDAPVAYDMRTRHAALLGARGDYFYDAPAVLADVADFARRWRAGAL